MNIYLNTETDFVHNGLGFLTDILKASVTDNLNGDYSLYFEYKINGQLSEYLKNENIIKCKVADGTKQLFIIKNVIKTFDSIQVSCKHIFYLLLDNFVEDTAPANLSCQTFLNWIFNKTNFPTNFQLFSDITTTKSARYVRKNPVEIILGEEPNSIVNLFGGELKRDNFNIYVDKEIGADNGVKLIIGKNITGINITVDTSAVYTRIMPQGLDGLFLPEKYIDSPLINNYINPKIYKIEFSDIKYDPDDELAYQDINEAYNALRNATNELFEKGIDKPTINIKVDWIELSKTNEYKNYSNLEKVMLGDTITIDLLGLMYQTKVVKTIYNPLTDRIESFELGTAKANIGTSTNNIQKQIESINPNSILESARDNATQLITQAMGGYVYKTQNELFIMDTNNINTATKVWRWNMNGLGYSKSGIDGPYETAMTSDGQIVADFITTGKLNTNVIEGYDQVVISVESQDNKIAQVTQTVEELNSKIGDIADITTSGEDTDAQVELDNINQSEPIRLVVRPIGENISYLYPSDNLYPSDELFMKIRTIRFHNNKTGEDFDYELPDDLLYYDSENYDEFILDYDGQSCVINKRVGYNADGTTYVLDTPKTVEYDFPKIVLTEGDYAVSILSYENGYIFARLMAKNIYTTQFYTKTEVDSEISQTANTITTDIDAKLKNYSTTTEMNNTITQSVNDSANSIKSEISNIYTTKEETTELSNTIEQKITDEVNEINLKVAKKANTTDVNASLNLKVSKDDKDQVVSMLNASADEINIKGNRLVVEADNFELDKNGNMICTNAKVTGEINSTTGNIGGWIINSNGLTNGTVFINNDGSSTIYTVADLIIIRGYIMGTPGFELSSAMIKHYDFNNDGAITASDYVTLQNLIGISMN